MKNAFKATMAEVERKYDLLISAPTFKCHHPPVEYSAKPGVYLLSEAGVPLYVGRTSNLRRRIQNHVRRSHNTATFAFLLARHTTGKKPSYRPEGSRADLLKNDQQFAVTFDKALGRIKMMDVQVIEEADSVRQALLEIYAACVSGAKHNDFNNH